MLRRTRPPRLSTRALARTLAASLAVVALAAPAVAATRGARPPRAMAVEPALGLPGLAVRFSGTHLPRHYTYRVYFDVTTSDKLPLCSGRAGARTTWRCTGRIPTHFGALGTHTVEMDATGPRGKGSFEELATFLVSDLGVTLSAPASTAQGDTVQLRVIVANGDSTGAKDVRVHDHLPAGLRIEKVTKPCVEARGLVSCGPMRMAPHTTRAVVITVIVTATQRIRLTDVVTVTGTPDPIKQNDVASVVLSVS